MNPYHQAMTSSRTFLDVAISRGNSLSKFIKSTFIYTLPEDDNAPFPPSKSSASSSNPIEENIDSPACCLFTLVEVMVMIVAHKRGRVIIKVQQPIDLVCCLKRNWVRVNVNLVIRAMPASGMSWQCIECTSSGGTPKWRSIRHQLHNSNTTRDVAYDGPQPGKCPIRPIHTL